MFFKQNKFKPMLDNYLNHFFGGNQKPEDKPKIKTRRNGLSSKKVNKDSESRDAIEDFLRENTDIPKNAMMIDLDNIPDDLPPTLKDVFDKLKMMKLTGELDDLEADEFEKIISDAFNDVLGDPSEESKIRKDGITIERKAWEMNDGTARFERLSKKIVSTRKKAPEERTLDVIKGELENAIEDEDYELAVKLREEMRDFKSVEKQPIKKKRTKK